MASCMRARTVSSLSTSKTPQGFQLGRRNLPRFAQPCNPDTLNPATLPSPPPPSPLTPYPRQIRQVRTPSPSPAPEFISGHLSSSSVSLSPPAHPANRPHDYTLKLSHSFMYRFILASPTKTFSPLSICFRIRECLSAAVFPNSSTPATHFSCSFRLPRLGFRSPRVRILDAIHSLREFVLPFTFSWFNHSSFIHSSIDARSPSNPIQRKRL